MVSNKSVGNKEEFEEQQKVISISEVSLENFKEYFLQSFIYHKNFFPDYFDFSKLLIKTYNAIDQLDNKSAQNKIRKIARDKLNYIYYVEKIPNIQWRDFYLLNPYNYCYLLKLLVDNFSAIRSHFDNGKYKNIKCCSLPNFLLGENRNSNTSKIILQWWNHFEQESIRKSIDFKYMVSTDISNFYPSIYTHTIAWALHGKSEAKRNRKNNLLGNKIDNCIQNFQYGETNGIPQGSGIMDFVSEILLAYCDKELGKKLEKENLKYGDYYILRYRDDYRIFSNTKKDGCKILLFLAKILKDCNLNLNPNKTKINEDIITNSIKSEKLNAIRKYKEIENFSSLQKKLLNIRGFILDNPNSTAYFKILVDFHKKVDVCIYENNKIKTVDGDIYYDDINTLVAILIDFFKIAPNASFLIFSIITVLIRNKKKEYVKDIIYKIKKKIGIEEETSNTDWELTLLWIQKIELAHGITNNYETYPLCLAVQKKGSFDLKKLWEHIPKNHRISIINRNNIPKPAYLSKDNSIIDKELFIKSIENKYITIKEVNLFMKRNNYY